VYETLRTDERTENKVYQTADKVSLLTSDRGPAGNGNPSRRIDAPQNTSDALQASRSSAP
jgi:hypothetical protein